MSHCVGAGAGNGRDYVLNPFLVAARHQKMATRSRSKAAMFSVPTVTRTIQATEFSQILNERRQVA